jgi:hypothetical protein
MIVEIIFMAALAVFAGTVIWKSAKKRTKKSCCE